MANINPTLNLNKTPNLVESNTLIFAKNIRLDSDYTIHRDYGIFPMSIADGKYAHYKVNYGDILNRISADIYYDIENTPNINPYYQNLYDRLQYIRGGLIHLPNGTIIGKGEYKIVGVISSNTEFYLFIYGKYTERVNDITTNKTLSAIIKYDEKLDKFSPCNCNWNYSGGTIYGCVINNIYSDKLLNIAESNANSRVPFKSINLNKSSITDDETIYTQTPNIPITNINYKGKFEYSIPNGTYQFFIRYKIRDNHYTNWFPASKELFAGNTMYKDTSFGTVKYLNTYKDSDTSFIFSIEHLFPQYNSNYESFQIGFIASHDNSVVARAWKHFDFKTEIINFDYKAEDALEIEVIDLLSNNYQIYDVGNVTNFKNKLYISNYKETDFNDLSLQETASAVNVALKRTEFNDNYGGYGKSVVQVQGEDVIDGLIINGNVVKFNGDNNIFEQLLTYVTSAYRHSVNIAITDALNNNTIKDNSFGCRKYDIECTATRDDLDKLKESIRTKYGDNYSNFEFPNDVVSVKVNGKIIETPTPNNIILEICNSNRYLNNDANFIDSSGVVNNTFKVEIDRICSFTATNCNSGGFDLEEDLEDTTLEDDTIGRPTSPTIPGTIVGSCSSATIRETYTQTITIVFRGDKTKINGNNNFDAAEYTTLIPYQKYKFYIHFVTQTGEITNGYLCGEGDSSILEVAYNKDALSVLYPEFRNIKEVDKYVACFFSILKVENNVNTIFNINKKDTGYEASSFDFNVGVNTPSNKLLIKQENNLSNNGKYYYSSDSSNYKYFGADGIIAFSSDNEFDVNKLAYNVIPYKVGEAKDIELVKCTPYIKLTTSFSNYSDYTNMNLLGYICNIVPLDREVGLKYYTDTATVFIKRKDSNDTDFYLSELKKYIADTSDVDERITSLRFVKTNNINIYSNYNLNYLTLREEPVEKYETYYSESSNASGTKTPYNLVLRLFASLTLNNIYSLSAMYKSYTRKTFSIHDKNSITEFNNTIRSSDLQSDEGALNIFKFLPNDYYNVPTNKGTITNLVAIGEAIIVHTKDSMFKFSGDTILQSADGEIQTTESTPFDTGITEMFGSEFGFAGLQSKDDYISTESHYIFFDRDAKVIYGYTGKGQITKISDSINKLFRHRPIKSIHFASDYYNNRIFISIKFTNENNSDKIYPVTLSFVINPNINAIGTTYKYTPAFISLHDFYFSKAFNTKTNCYFITDYSNDICTINKNYYGSYTKLELPNDSLYPARKEEIKIRLVANDIENAIPELYSVNSYDSIIDIIDNTNFEIIKTLNYIQWCGNTIYDDFVGINYDDLNSLKVAEDTVVDVPYKAIRIYSDTCMSPLMFFGDKSNNSSLDSSNSYKQPRYNQGIWNFNYFRNIQNSNNNISKYVSDENSLIEGKYFVIRFIFDREFKLETLTLNYNIKQ